jgi:drug/metabolite transporter (DMT)-like permease
MKFKGFIALLLAAIIFASFGIFIRILNQDLGSYQQIIFRNLFGFIISFLPIILLRQSFKSLNKIPKYHLIPYAIAFPLSVVFFTLSILNTKISTTLFSFYTGNLITSLMLGKILFKEKFTKIKAIAFTIVLMGVFIYTYPLTLASFNVGFLLGLIAGLFDTITNVFRKHIAGKADRFVLVNIQMLGGILVASVAALLFNQFHIPEISNTSWAIGAIFGIGLIGISYLTLVGFQNFDLNLGTIILSSEVFFAILFAFMFFNEEPKTTELIGATLVFLATGVVNLDLNKFSSMRKRQK